MSVVVENQIDTLRSPYIRLTISSPPSQPSHSFLFLPLPPIPCYGGGITCVLLDGRADTMTTSLNLRRALAVLVALGFQCFPVNAQEQQVISGIGAKRCAALTAKGTAGANTNDALTAALTWIEGFISGLNMNAENDFYYDLTSITSEQQNVQILAYCRNHPSEAVMNAGLHLAQNYLAKKPTHPH
jgi:hypothetical protein